MGDPGFLHALWAHSQMMLIAMVIIWLGAHASLRRPPSAALSKPKNGEKKVREDARITEGLVASDAILLPVMGAIVLIGIYYLIKYLDDPDLFNKCLRAYMAFISIISVGKFFADALAIIVSLVFPTTWSQRSGNVYRINSVKQTQALVDRDDKEVRIVDKSSPLPGLFSRLPLSAPVLRKVWSIRRFFLLTEWPIHLYLFDETIHMRPTEIIGFLAAVATAISYPFVGGNLLNNLIGTCCCYAAFSVLSPTSFFVGTLVLVGLFVYDIIMVFYTPFMMAVATKVDAPIKLVFETSFGSEDGAAKTVSILGLGDIVVPGIFIALALRFDLYQYYLRKIRYVPTELVTEVTSTTEPGKTVILKETKDLAVKEPFVDRRGQWGDWFWTAGPLSLFSKTAATQSLEAMAFPRPYFYSCMLGYATGMLMALVAIGIFKQGQPALLYLVPCVTGASWLTGYLRGELTAMQEYTEDGSLDKEDVVVDIKGPATNLTTIT